MRRVLTASFALCMVAPACAGGLGSSGCTDDYRPEKRTSCSYDPVFASLHEERGANIGKSPIRTADGSSSVYLIVDPPRISPDGEIAFSILNTSSVEVEVGPDYRLEPADPERGDCAFAEAPVLVGSDEESETIRFAPCKQGDLRPGLYELIVALDAPAAESGPLEIVASVEIVDQGSG